MKKTFICVCLSEFLLCSALAPVLCEARTTISSPNVIVSRSVYPRISNGYYKIRSANVDRYLDVKWGSTGNGANIILYDNTENANQVFYLKNTGDGYFTLTACHTSNKVLDAAGGYSNAGTNVQLWQNNGTNAQRWRLMNGGNNVSFFIESKLRRNLVFDATGAGRANGTNIQLWTRENVNWHKWKFEPTSNPNNWVDKANRFINDPRWRNGAAWGVSKTPEVSPYDSRSCCAYTADFVKKVFGKDSPRSGTVFYNLYDIKAGDVLEFSAPHWIVVLSRNGNNLRTAEANVGNPRQVRISNNYNIVASNRIAWGNVSYYLTKGYHFR